MPLKLEVHKRYWTPHSLKLLLLILLSSLRPSFIRGDNKSTGASVTTNLTLQVGLIEFQLSRVLKSLIITARAVTRSCGRPVPSPFHAKK